MPGKSLGRAPSLRLYPGICITTEEKKYGKNLGQSSSVPLYRGADKSLGRPGRKQAQKHVSNARSFNNIETLAVIKVYFPPCKARRQRKFTPF